MHTGTVFQAVCFWTLVSIRLPWKNQLYCHFAAKQYA